MVNNYYKIDHKSEGVYSTQFLCTELSSIHSDESDECLQTYILATVLFIYMASYSVDFRHPNPPQTIN